MMGSKNEPKLTDVNRFHFIQHFPWTFRTYLLFHYVHFGYVYQDLFFSSSFQVTETIRNHNIPTQNRMGDSEHKHMAKQSKRQGKKVERRQCSN